MSNGYQDSAEEPGVPGRDTDKDCRPYFFPSNRQRPADLREQWDGFTSRWEYYGHTDAIKSVCVTGEDSLGRIRVASTDGKDVHSWLELKGDIVKAATSTQFDTITGIIFVTPLDVLAAASRKTLLIFERRTLKHLATLPTSKTLSHLEYNHTRDEIITGGSEGCYVWSLRVAVASDSCYAPVVTAPFELALLRGFKGCSQWTGKMVWDEPGQVIIAIDGTMINVCEVTTGANVHRIEGAHDAPVAAAMWYGESEHIATGCVSGILKIWACQHTDAREKKSSQMTKNITRPRSRKRNNGRRLGRRKRVRRRQSPALMASFRAHCGVITGIIRHCVNTALIVSSSTDGTLRLWDVDRLTPVSTIRMEGGSVESMAAYSNPGGGRPRLLCTGKGGTIRTMLAQTVCEPLGDIPQEAQKIRYYARPPVSCYSGTLGASAAPHLNASHFVEGGRGSKLLPRGFLLVQMRQGLWGVMSESRLLTADIESMSRSEAKPPPRTMRLFKEFSQARQRQNVLRHWQQHHLTKKEDDDERAEALYEGNKNFALFEAWAPLPSVTERYTHHALSCGRRKVVCLTDSGLLDAYVFGSERGEARKVASWKLELQSSAAKATCMCLLPTTPSLLVATLDRLIAAHGPASTGFGTPRGDVGEAGGEEGNITREQDIAGDGGGGDVMRRSCKYNTDDWKGDQVAAIGTSYGAVLLVETIVNGTTLACLEGVFADKVLDIAFYDASADTASTTGASSRRTSAERLVCTGYNTNGTVTIKGLALPSFSEAFSIGLIEVPTCLGFAGTQTLLAIGYVDGTVQAMQFAEDRVCDMESSELTGAHKAEIQTIAFSERYRCMATGSADGDVNIWGDEGNLLHSIHLQDAVRTVAFADVVGQLVVSQAPGIRRIPACRWCPQRLLEAVERAERRRKTSGNFSGSSGVSGDTGGPTEGRVCRRVSAKIESPPVGGCEVTIRVDNEGENPLSTSSNKEDYSRLEQQREDMVARTTTSGGRYISNKVDRKRAMGHGSTATKNVFIGKRCYPAASAPTATAAPAASQQRRTGGGRDQLRVVSAQESIMPSEINGNGGCTPAPFTVIRRPIRKERYGVEDQANTQRPEPSMSILDRMKSKVACMSGSPPPLNVRATRMGEHGGKERMLPRSAATNGTVVHSTCAKSTAMPLTLLATVINDTPLVLSTTCSPPMSAPVTAESYAEYPAALSEEDPRTTAEDPLEATVGVIAANVTPVATRAPAVDGTKWSPTIGATPTAVGVVLSKPEDITTLSFCSSPHQCRCITSRHLVDGSRFEKLFVEGQRQTNDMNLRKHISQTRDSPTRCVSACERPAVANSAIMAPETWRRNKFATIAPTEGTVAREARHRYHGVREVDAGGDGALLDGIAFSVHSSEDVPTRDTHGVPAPTPPYPPQAFSFIAARVSKNGDIEIPDMAGAKHDTGGLKFTAPLLAVGATIQATGPPMVIRSFTATSAQGSKRNTTTPLPGISGGVSTIDTARGGRGGGAAKNIPTTTPQSAILTVSSPSSPSVTPTCPRCQRATRVVSPRARNRDNNAASSNLSWDNSSLMMVHFEGEEKGSLLSEENGQDGTTNSRSPVGGGSPFFPVRPVYRRGSPRGFGSPRVLGSRNNVTAERGGAVRVPDVI